MQYLGFVLLGFGIVGLLVGYMQMLKKKKILAAPFKGTGEISKDAALSGAISTQGAVQAEQLFTAPCSGKPCIYYDVKIERLWEKTEQTENGAKKSTGSSTLLSKQEGTTFLLNDGSGAVRVDAREKVDCNDTVKSFDQKQNIAAGRVVYGSIQVDVPGSNGKEYTTGVKVTEMIIPADGNLFAMGKIGGGVIAKSDGALGKLLLSTRGREKMIGSTARNSTLGFALGGLLLLPGGYYSIFGKPPVDSCAGMVDAPAEVCHARYTSGSKSFTWNVAKAGAYAITVNGTGTNSVMKLWPNVTISKGGAPVAQGSQAGGEPTEIQHCFEPGDYTIRIADVDPKHVQKLSGGVGFDLKIVPGTGACERAAAADTPSGGSAGGGAAGVGASQ